MKFFGLVFLASLIISLSVRATEETVDQQYLRIYNWINQADTFSSLGNDNSAKQKYKEAQIALQDFKKKNPSWNASVVSFRLDYLDAKINPRSAPVATATESIAATAKPKPEQKPAPKPAAKKVAASPATASPVKLISAGAEPRKELRIHPKAGDKQNLDMTIKMAMDMGTGQSMKMPATKMAMEVTVKNISAAGEISYESVIGNVEVLDEPGAMPQVVESMKTALNGMKGLSMTGTMSDRGIPKSLDLKIPAGVAPQLRQAMEQMKESFGNMSSPFPDEAVGVGAKWEVKRPVKSQGMTIDQATTYELKSLKDDQANVASTISQNAANQKISNPAMPQMKMDLVKMAGNGTGNVTFDLAHFFPSLAIINSHSDTSMKINMGDKVQDISMKMDMNMRMEAK
ncbi:MAG: DUF6263 family protein [Verrucomicrobiota bacterium]